MKIGELAKATGTPVDTIRYYERAELLQSTSRTDANYRVYGEEHTQRLLFIRRCRSLDMALDEIRVLLRFLDAPTENCGDVNALLDQHIEHVAERVRELRSLEKHLKALREKCQQASDARHCGILNGLAHRDPSSVPAAPSSMHVPGAHRRGSHA